jgi:hypothetical protein
LTAQRCTRWERGGGGGGELRPGVLALAQFDPPLPAQNEHEVGEALSVIFAEGVVTRPELFITSKLWNSDHAPERVEAAARHSLKALQVCLSRSLSLSLSLPLSIYLSLFL